MRYEAVLFLLSVGTGIFLCLCYQLLAALRSIFPHSSYATALEDIVYWTAAGIFVFCMVYRFHQGILRSFLFAGIFLGGWICRYTIGPFFRRFMETVCGIPVNFVKKNTKRLLFLFKSCSILKYKHEILRQKKVLKKKRFSHIEKVKKKEDKKKNNE